ncbi:hypothetical protein [Halomarina rubra]|uniref:Uncharacterized protein n=1 Tax=Halomarina rubra TaxID=2071873 RepID=A0ABD6AQQ8_9EURY|nr:hypothetical protein [Halomarina rubra]
MTEYTLHVPSIRGTTKNAPDMPYQEDDFATDDLADIDDYFLLSTSDIPPEGFDDLYIPVAHLDQRLSLPLLRRAVEELDTLEDLDAETKKATIDMIHDLAECFPDEGLDAGYDG